MPANGRWDLIRRLKVSVIHANVCYHVYITYNGHTHKRRVFIYPVPQTNSLA